MMTMKLKLTETLKKSYWEKDFGPVEELPPLEQCIRADVAIIGGGFVGLWTALTIKEYEPNCKVVILEKDSCGRGASGRNGGLVMSWWPKIVSLNAFCGQEEALFLAKSAENAIDELRVFCEENNIHAQFNRGGWLWTATSPAHINSWNAAVLACEKLGVHPFERVSGTDLSNRICSRVHLEAVFEASNATVQPFALVQGMRRVALEKGVEIYEKSPVTKIKAEEPIFLSSTKGGVYAGKVILATNAWSASIPELSKIIVPVNSSVVATHSLAQEMVWAGEESITDSQLLVNYYRTTSDNRIVFGKGTGATSYGSKINKIFSEDEDSIQLTLEDFFKTFPQLQTEDIQYVWSGPIDRTFDSLPVFGHFAKNRNIIYGVGWSGNGVGPSRIGGRILASLALGKNNQWSKCALVGRQLKRFPPEPLRFFGGKLVRNAVLRKEKAERNGRKPKHIDLYLSRLAPAGLEDK